MGELLEYLDKSEETDKLYEMLRSRNVSEIEELCKTFPIETLRLDWDSIQRDFRNSKRFELVTFFAQILVRYDTIL
jgi:ActR/RegA family two-component response regulator